MHALIDIFELMVLELYTPLKISLLSIPILQHDIYVGLTTITIGETIAGMITLVLTMYIIYLPIKIVKTVIKRFIT